MMEGEVHPDLPLVFIRGIEEVDLQGDPRVDRGFSSGGPGLHKRITLGPFESVVSDGMHPVRKVDLCQVCTPGEGISTDFFQSIRQHDAGDGGVAVKSVFLNDGQSRRQYKGVRAGRSNHTEDSNQADKQENCQSASVMCP